MPKKKAEAVEAEIIEERIEKSCCEKGNNSGGRLFLGLVFLLVGTLIFLNNFFPDIELAKYFWPILFIVFGFSLITKSL